MLRNASASAAAAAAALMLDNEEKASRIGLGVARGQVREEPLAGHKYLLSFLFSPSRVRQPEGTGMKVSRRAGDSRARDLRPQRRGAAARDN